MPDIIHTKITKITENSKTLRNTIAYSCLIYILFLLTNILYMFSIPSWDTPAVILRHYSIIANWDEVFFAGTKYKSLLPLNAKDMAKQTVTDANDKQLKDVNIFYREYNKDLVKVQHDLNRFTSPVRNK